MIILLVFLFCFVYKQMTYLFVRPWLGKTGTWKFFLCVLFWHFCQISPLEMKFTYHLINHFIVNNSVAFSTFTMYATPPLFSFKTSSSPKIKPCTHSAITPHCMLPASPPPSWSLQPPICFLFQ